MGGCKGSGTRLRVTPWRGGRGIGKPINFSWAIIPGEKWEWSEKWEWARGSRSVITKAPLHEKAPSAGLAEHLSEVDAQAPPKDLRIGLSQLSITGEETEAQSGQ